jgi:hypothetical protein
MSMTWLDAVDTIRKARNKAAGKPLAEQHPALRPG